MSSQPGILADLPRAARFVTWRLKPAHDPRPALSRLAQGPLASVVVGIGQQLTRALGVSIEGLGEHPVDLGGPQTVPSTPAPLWTWLRADDPGALVHLIRTLSALLAPAFEIAASTEAFKHREGRDLTGYVDGTENPVDEAAAEAALITGRGPGLDGGSFVAVQRWLHDWDAFALLSETQRDHTIGRRLSDDEELADAPASAHVKRTEQESFSPQAFVLRRSLPWTDGEGSGLLFVAFGRSMAAYEAQLGRMLGAEDGVVDALFQFTQPETGAYYFCPPMTDGRLDLRALGLEG